MTNQHEKKKIFVEPSIINTTNHKRLNKELEEAMYCEEFSSDMGSDSQVIVKLKDFLKKNKNDQDLR